MPVVLFTAIFYVFLEALLGRNWGLTPQLKFNLNSRYLYVCACVWWWCFAKQCFSYGILHPREAGDRMAEGTNKAVLGCGTSALQSSLVSQLVTGGQRQLTVTLPVSLLAWANCSA